MPINKQDTVLLLIRAVFGFRLIYGAIDNIVDWNRMLEFKEFLFANGFPFPLVCAIISVYAQFLAGISWILGYQVKIFSFFMIINFVVAIIGVHLLHNHTYLDTAPAVHLLAISIGLYLLGPGNYAVRV